MCKLLTLSKSFTSLAFFISHTLQIKLGPEPGPGTSEKVEKTDPRPLEKEDSFRKFTVWVKHSLLTNPRVLISNMTLVFFLNFSQKQSNKAFLVPNLGTFVLARNFIRRH